MTEPARLFVKLMMLTTSSHDGEALNALRKANGILAAANINWEELLTVQLQKEAYSPSMRPASGVAEPIIEEMLEDLLKNVTGSFRDFVISINEWYEDKGFLTEKQYAAIKKAWDMRNP